MELVESNAFSFDEQFKTLTINSTSVRVLGSVNQPWFSGKDLCMALGYNSRNYNISHILARYVDESDKTTLGELVTNNLTYNEGKAVYVNEPGAYSLALHCTLPIGKAFKKWLTHDALPSMRQAAVQLAVKQATKRQNDTFSIMLKDKEDSFYHKETNFYKRMLEKCEQNNVLQQELKNTKEQLDKLKEDTDFTLTNKDKIKEWRKTEMHYIQLTQKQREQIERLHDIINQSYSLEDAQRRVEQDKFYRY